MQKYDITYLQKYDFLCLKSNNLNSADNVLFTGRKNTNARGDQTNDLPGHES